MTAAERYEALKKLLRDKRLSTPAARMQAAELFIRQTTPPRKAKPK